jgi:NAD-dependent dihydropyrimidine dehydrogenase PreA subunit
MSHEFDFDFDLPGDEVGSHCEFDKIDRDDQTSDRLETSVIRIDHDLCDNTEVCVEVCPEDVLELGKGHAVVARPEACTECWICVENCVSGAIDIG